MALEDIKLPQIVYAVVSLLQGQSNQRSPLLSGQEPAPQNLRIYLSLRIFSNNEILKFDWLRTQI